MDDTHSYDSWGSAGDRFAEGELCIGIDLGTTNSCTLSAAACPRFSGSKRTILTPLTVFSFPFQ